ncbi:superoxide dismutase [Fibrobacter sp. UWB4]|uniref:superoxide dismutase n=1 Tax=Fibrobacter sp. UWB4 TaxID=1964356 RepID=UPI000B522E8F|nr:superoxide dismutase [Fibrobacter sp. UWB4]OWV20213.1 superoxide dismutase [Fibrobacter sp. UWB4]
MLQPVNGKFDMPTLPYGTADLAPALSQESILFHFGKHLQTYVNNLNAALPGSGFEGKSLEEIVKSAEGGIFNNAGQILNHTLYFLQFKPASSSNVPTGRIAELIVRDFGTFEKFKDDFQTKGAGLFGSGWVWLSATDNEKLVITQEANAQNPITKDLKPLLTFDVWEHAYYIDYRNRRPDYLKALWNIVNWDVVNERLG